MNAMESQRKSGPRQRSYSALLAAAFLVALPAIVFYAILFHTALNIPFFDDYDAVLDFMNRLSLCDGLSAKASCFLASQHNEYKLFFEQAIVWLQFDLVGHINFQVLCAIGNAFVLLLAFLLWKMFLPAHKDLGSRLALFIPVPWLLFQFQYHETLNWAMAGLQNLPVLLFSFAAIYLLLRATQRAFCGALLCYILAVASSGNGFLLLPIGLLILALGRYYARVAVWLIASAGCIAAYSYHYNVMSSQSAPHHSVFSTLARLRPLYIISFMGSAASIPFPSASFALGSGLCIFFIWMVCRGFIRKNPLVSCCVLFLLLTAIGVAGIRSDLGLMQSLSSRYAIYSALLLIFAWFAVAEEFLEHSRMPLLSSWSYLGSVTLAVFFCLIMDALGFFVMNQWNGKLVEGMALFEHASQPDSASGPLIPLWKGDEDREAFNPRARTVLIESIRLGVYRPPPL